MGMEKRGIMGSLNQVTLIGNLGRDPELRTTSGGQTVCEFSIATTDKWTDKSGAKQERTEWHRIVYWGKGGEACGQYLSKGSLVCVQGSIRSEKYQDKQGFERTKYQIHATHVEFIDTKGGKRSAAAKDDPDATAPVGDDSDIPF